jgi:hypothetical protein
VDLQGAKKLAAEQPFQFQSWALGFVYARRTAEAKKGADKGIDGKLLFTDERDTRRVKTVIFSVKGGQTGPDHVRDLRGVIDREGAQIGVLLTLREPTSAMKTEAGTAGYYTTPFGGTQYPRLQIITVQDLLDGKKVQMPAQATITTYRKPRQARPGVTHRQAQLDEYGDDE